MMIHPIYIVFVTIKILDITFTSVLTVGVPPEFTSGIPLEVNGIPLEIIRIPSENSGIPSEVSGILLEVKRIFFSTVGCFISGHMIFFSSLIAGNGFWLYFLHKFWTKCHIFRQIFQKPCKRVQIKKKIKRIFFPLVVHPTPPHSPS